MRVWTTATVGLVGWVSIVATGCGDDSPVSGSGTSSGGSTTVLPTATGPGDSTTSGTTTSASASGDGDSTTAETLDGSSSSGTTEPTDDCGNDVIEGDEACDGTDLAGQTCESQGFDAGTLACARDCSAFDDSGCGFFNCGDSIAEGREQCDGPDLGTNTCLTEGFDSGTLACDALCLLDTSGCGTCGNVIVDGDEACDDVALFGQTCQDEGFDSGTIACQADCMGFDTTGCGTCGNAIIDGDEVCDAALLGGSDCLAEGFDSGTLACDADCLVYDTAGCGTCGNGVVDGDELCDSNAVAGQTCQGQGFDSGLLTCDATCNGYDTSNCGICGNGIVDGYEACDDANMIDDDACPNDCGGGDRLIFVTSVMFDGNLGGLLGADAECQALATAAGLPGVYMAWLSTAAESPSTRMTQSTTPYVRPDGVQVAPDWAGLVDGTLDAPINVTEIGGAVPIGNTSCAGGGFPTVWTATATNGTSQGSSCADWTSDVGTARWGRANNTDGSWTSWCQGGTCSWLSPLYCVQQ